MDNIILSYPFKVLFAPGMETVLFARKGGEVFIDEHGVQWIKFVAQNGPGAGKEHMIRTDQIVIVREDG
jgi:hypothetical protein